MNLPLATTTATSMLCQQLTLTLSFLGSTNLVGKFTQSVRRIVQDVKDEPPASGMTRDEVIETNERLRAVRIRLEESYDTAKKSLVNLMNKYGDSKIHRNIFNRYPLLKIMIKVRLSILNGRHCIIGPNSCSGAFRM